MGLFKIMQVDPGQTWLRQVNIVGNGSGNAGFVLVQSQNHGLVEWWTGLPAVSLTSGFVMNVVTAPTSLTTPAPPAGSVTWTAYGSTDTSWVAAPGGTTLSPGNLQFVGTDPGTSDVWYLQIQWPTPISDGWLKWFRPASAPPRFLGSGTSMAWNPLATPTALNNYVTLTDVIPKQ